MNERMTEPGYVLRSTQRFRETPQQLFDFFAAPSNLGRITPPWLNFQVVAPEVADVEAGTLIAYRLRLHGVPMRWLTEISAWEPPRRFVDTQLAGPYRYWVHEHLLEAEADGTAMHDTVRFLTRGPAVFAPIVHQGFVNPRVKSIFRYRQGVLGELFDSVSTSPVMIERMGDDS